MEALDERTLLAVTFEFTIFDPSGKYKATVPKLQALLNAAGHEWSTHLQGNAKLEYIVGIVDSVPDESRSAQRRLADGAAKSAEVIRTEPNTGLQTFQVGTAREMITGVDPNGAKPDGGITIYGPNLSLWYFEENTNLRNAPIRDGAYDGYTIILHELAHSLGFVSTRNALGEIPSLGQFTYDEHVTVMSPGFLTFGLGTQTFDPQTGDTVIDPSSDDAFQVYRGEIDLQIGNPNHLGAGRFVEPGFVNQVDRFFFFRNQFFVDDLSTDLMSGVLNPGERRSISRLDLAILRDAETPVNLTVDEFPEGLFAIDGTGLPDHIDVSLTNGTLLVRVNDSLQSFGPEASLGITAIVINGLNGNDTITVTGNFPSVAINGGTGNDTIYGGPKADALFGGGGNDLLVGRSGGDFMRGGDGNDTVLGQGGSDRLFGDAGFDYVDGGVQGDRLFGGPNSDTLVGGTGDDFLYGDSGNDVLSGAGGKDRMEGGLGADTFFGGAGNDSVDYSRASGSITASIDASPDDGVDGESDNIIDTENIIGSSFDDLMIGSQGGDGLIGNAGNDTLVGGGGHDFLEGNNGLDLLDGGGGHDNLQGGDGNDTLTGGTGLDVFFGGLGDDTFTSGDGEVDTINGDDGQDTVSGDDIDELFEVEVADVGPGGRSQPDRVVTPPSRKVTFS